MTDLLVKLYMPLPTLDAERLAAEGFRVRRAVAPEKIAAGRWVEKHFGERWASEVAVAFARQPVACFLALAGRRMVGFACYDATARGFFGPTGVDESVRGKGLGQALLLATLRDMREQGYGYAIIGGVGPVEFYEKAVGAMVIPDSTPGIYPPMIEVP